MFDAITVGDIKMDMFLNLPQASVMCKLRTKDCQLCLAYGEKIPAESTHMQIAGTASNVAIGLARMERSTAVVSAMGNDATHALALSTLANERVETRYIQANERKSSSFAAVLNFRGESTQLVTHSGAEVRLPKTLPAATWLHVAELGEMYQKTLQDLLRVTKRHTVRLSFNPGRLQINERSPELFRLIAAADLLFLNLTEARQLVRLPATARPAQIANKIHALGAKTTVLTDGPQGVYAFNGQQLLACAAFPAKFIEATGAGDAFTAGYLGALLHGNNDREALRWGAVNAASVVSHIGPTAGLLHHQAIIKRLAGRRTFTPRVL